jgi:hypothetical protein
MRSFRPESAFNCENPEVWILKLTAIARASTADGFGYQSVGKMTEAGLLSLVWSRSIPSWPPTQKSASSACFIPLLLVRLVGGAFAHLAHETEVNVLRRDSHIKRKSTSRILKIKYTSSN